MSFLGFGSKSISICSILPFFRNNGTLLFEFGRIFTVMFYSVSSLPLTQEEIHTFSKYLIISLISAFSLHFALFPASSAFTLGYTFV